jgi:hypothetical protein
MLSLSNYYPSIKRKLPLLISLMFLIVYFPILLSHDDLWDGTIISHAWDSGNKIIFSTWFNESGWPLVRWLYEILYEICLTFGLNFKIVINFITVAAVALSGREIYRLSMSVYKFDECSSLLGTLFFILTPFSCLYFSSAFVQLALFIYLCLWGTRIYLEEKSLPLALLLIGTSFQHNSNPCLLFCLVLLAYVFGGRRQFKKDAGVLFVLGCWYFLFKMSFQPYGLYTGYNKINIYNIINIKFYALYLIFFIMAYPALLLASLIFIFKAKGAAKYIFLFLGLAIITEFPYIAVGKTFQMSGFGDVAFWDYRHTINSSVVVSIAVVFLLHLLAKVDLSAFWKGTLRSILTLAILFNVIFVLCGFKQRANDYVYQDTIVKYFRDNKDKIKAGFIKIINIDNFYHQMTNYEMNYYLYQAFGEKRLELDTGINTDLRQHHEYRDKYVLLDEIPDCTYVVTISSNTNKLPMFDKIAYLYLWKSRLESKLKSSISIREECGQSGPH